MELPEAIQTFTERTRAVSTIITSTPGPGSRQQKREFAFRSIWTANHRRRDAHHRRNGSISGSVGKTGGQKEVIEEVEEGKHVFLDLVHGLGQDHKITMDKLFLHRFPLLKHHWTSV
ncbi:Enolase [Trichinella pseudospiralis]